MRFFPAYYDAAPIFNITTRGAKKQKSHQNTNSITSKPGLEDFFLELYNKSQVLRKIIEERRLRYKY